jgi:hypothetical protein
MDRKERLLLVFDFIADYLINDDNQQLSNSESTGKGVINESFNDEFIGDKFTDIILAFDRNKTHIPESKPIKSILDKS